MGLKVDQSTVKRVSPSPSNKYLSTGYSKGNQPYDSRVRVSPSPPSNKIPSQNIIGFNTLNQAPSQYSSQTLSNTGYPPVMQGSSPAQLLNPTIQPNGQQMAMLNSNIPSY